MRANIIWLLVLVLLASGCSKTPEQQRKQQHKTAVAELMKMNNAQNDPDSPQVREAAEALKSNYTSKIIKCGDSWYASLANDGAGSSGPSTIEEYKNFELQDPNIEVNQPGRAEEYSGNTRKEFTIYRTYSNNYWSEWSERGSMTPDTVTFHKRRGEAIQIDDSFRHIQDLRCDQIPG